MEFHIRDPQNSYYEDVPMLYPEHKLTVLMLCSAGVMFSFSSKKSLAPFFGQFL